MWLLIESFSLVLKPNGKYFQIQISWLFFELFSEIYSKIFAMRKQFLKWFDLHISLYF